MKLYAHPFSSYCQKVLVALYENDLAFEFRMLAPDDQAASSEHEALWPLKRMPVLVDEGRTVVEASIIVEYLALRYGGPVQSGLIEPTGRCDSVLPGNSARRVPGATRTLCGADARRRCR